MAFPRTCVPAALGAIVAFTALLALAPTPAQAGPHHGWHCDRWRFEPRFGHHHRHHPWVGHGAYGRHGGGVSVTFGTGRHFFNHGVWVRPHGPRYVVVAPPAAVFVPAVPQGYTNEAPVVTAPPVVAPKAPPIPVIYPRNGQSPDETEGDRQDCNRWATTQDAALLDAEVFQRAVAACMDGRGYTVR